MRLQVSGLGFFLFFSLFLKSLRKRIEEEKLTLFPLSLSTFCKCSLNEEDVAVYDAAAALWHRIGVELGRAHAFPGAAAG